MGLAHGANIVKDGLVFYVDAANQRSYPGSGTTCNTLVGSNEGTLQSSHMFENINMGAFDLDGADEEISFSNATNFPVSNSVRTMVIWFKADPTDWGSIERGIFSYGSGLSHNGVLITMYAAGSVRVRMGYNVGFGSGLVDNEWHSVAVTFNGGILCYCWIDNIAQGSGYQYAVNTSATSPKIGNYANQRFLGQIGPIMVYNRELPTQELTQNYNALKGRFGL